MIEHWRIYAIIFLMTVSLVDLGLTYYYVSKYKTWQPNKPYEKIELNPLLRFLWNTFGLHLGMFIGAVVILSLNYVVGRYAHWIVVLILIGFISLALFNHFKNINLLFKLINKYPTGHLPESVFGKVVGNN